ncbi:MAG: PAS domain S-box protein [Rhodospirillales bacterium]|nr:PAS domain S-box protein [Rhodospirillales bacterium]
MSVLVAAVLLIAVGSFMTYRAVVDLLASKNLVDHTHTVMSATDDLFANLSRSMASANTFIVTGNDVDLAAFRKASTDIATLVTELRFMTADNEFQQGRINELADLLRAWATNINAMIEARRAAGQPTGEVVEKLRLTAFFHDQVARILGAVSDEERRLFRIRDEAAERDANDIVLIVGGANAVSIAIICILFYLAQRETRRRADAIGQLRTLNAQMDARVRERTAELDKAVEALEAEVAVRRRSESAEQVARNTLEAVIDASPVAIVCVATDRSVLMWSRAAEQLFGYTREEAVGQPYKLVPPGHEAEFDALFERALAGETLRDIEVRRQRKDGSFVDISFDGAVMRDATGTRGVAYALTDITRRKSTERQLRQAQKMEAVGNLTGGMAHDFNNLLSIVIGNVDLLLSNEALDPETAELAREALDAALRGASLTQRLLAFARRQPLQPERIEIDDLIANLARLLRRTVGEDIDLRISEGESVWPVVVDPAQLEASIVNLVNNARDAMPDGGTLSIATRNRILDEDYASLNPGVAAGDYAMIEVSDSGTGMTRETMNSIFEPFFTTKEQGKGSGLGLSMVFGFMKQSGGHIGVYSEVGVGTTFRLYLPRATSGEANAARAEAAPAGGNETILIVEDNDALRRVAERQIGGLGYRVVVAENGPAALDALERGPVDLVFSDIVMPGGMNGVELAKSVVARWPRTRILLTSGFPEGRKGRTASLPANFRLLAKPYRKEELARRLREALDA